jgi:histidyl-tRNA synthetase
MAKGASALPGFRDFYPEDFAARAHIQNAWREVARRFGFVEYDGPPLEPLDLYTKKSGDEIVGQLYNFKDKGDRDVALRPEMTPTFARMVGARANALPKPIKWFSIPQLFRYERQQKGRLREHFQLNVDIVGEPDVSADAELLAVAVECMAQLGLGSDDVKARVSDRRLLAAILKSLNVADDKTAEVFAVIDKLDRQPRDVSLEKLRDAGVAAAAAERVVALKDLHSFDAIAAAFPDPGVAACLDDFRRYLGHAAALKIGDWVVVDLTIVRGLAYYTGIVFELFDAKGELRAICGGGRYDTLLAALGGADLPALGFGMGDVVLGELLKERGKLPAVAKSLDVWVAYEDEASFSRAMKVATSLRRAGKAVEYSLHHVQLGKQMEAASKAGAARAIILKSDGSAVERDLATKSEKPFTFVDG